MVATGKALLIARREVRLLSRSRATQGALVLLVSVAWLPAILLPLRRGSLGVASFTELLPLQIALGAVILPLLALLAGAELFAGELEDGSLIPALTLSISRRACFVGKCLGRAATLGAAYLVAFASAGLAVAATHGGTGWRDWAVVTASGLLVSFSSGGVGAALGAAGSGRVRAFGAALVTWIILVFALDALLLTIVVALAPPPPGSIGEHGHGEVAAPRAPPTEMPIHQGVEPVDPHARHAEPEGPKSSRLSGGLMALNPVSLFRVTSLAASPGLRLRLALALPGGTGAGLGTTIVAGWLIWLVAPLAVGLRRFVRADLT
ncbi:MAG: ABC transporter permease [Acidobacteriota bacterium]|nr:ABC transporter permease [Acidobacteriota bacterium]